MPQGLLLSRKTLACTSSHLTICSMLPVIMCRLSLSATCTYVFYRDVGIKAIELLMEKKGRFDYVILETTGLADPGEDPLLSLHIIHLHTYL